MNILMFKLMILSSLFRINHLENKLINIKNLTMQLKNEFYNDDIPQAQKDEHIHVILCQLDKILAEHENESEN